MFNPFDTFNSGMGSLGTGISRFVTPLAAPVARTVAQFAPTAGSAIGAAIGAPFGASPFGAIAGREIGKWGGNMLSKMAPNYHYSHGKPSGGFQGAGALYGREFGNFLTGQLPPQYQGQPLGQMAKTFGQDVGSRIGQAMPSGMEGIGPYASSFLGDQFSSMVPPQFGHMGLGDFGGHMGEQAGGQLDSYLQSSGYAPMPFSQRSPLPTLQGVPRLSEAAQMYNPMMS